MFLIAGFDNNSATKLNHPNCTTIIQPPIKNNWYMGISGDRTRVNTDRKYSGAFGFKALQIKPSDMSFQDDSLFAPAKAVDAVVSGADFLNLLRQGI